MIYLSQRDRRWAAQKMGASPLTVGRMGCTTTCVSMLSDYFKCYLSPKQIASVVKNYTKDGLILWWNLAFDKMQFVQRIRGFNKKAIDASLLHPDTAVILEVNYGAHWVVALRKSPDGKDYLVLDPWDGKKRWAKKAFANISGSAHFKRK